MTVFVDPIHVAGIFISASLCSLYADDQFLRYVLWKSTGATPRNLRGDDDSHGASGAVRNLRPLTPIEYPITQEEAYRLHSFTTSAEAALRPLYFGRCGPQDKRC